MKRNVRILITLLAVLLCLTTLAGCSAMQPEAPDAMEPGAMIPNSAPADDADVGGWMEEGNEEYTEIVENGFVNASETPDSYFSIDANTASYPNLRSMIQNGYPSIPKDAVRVEEMLNYFDYNYNTPTDGAIFALNASMFDTP